QLVFVRELVDAQDGDDVLELLVPLEDLLDAPGHLVVLLAHDLRGQKPRRGGQGVHRRVDPPLRNAPLQVGGGVQVGEGGGGGRVGVVVGRDVDRLDGG